MAAWVLLLNVVFNFIYGVMLPLIPALNAVNAGVAFSAFAVAKVLCLPIAGRLGDRVGHAAGLTIALILQISALGCIALLPAHAWIGRILEGAALAQGMVSAVSLLRVTAANAAAFSKDVSRLMSGGALGFIVGPLAGYLLLPLGGRPILFALIALTAALLVLHVGRHRSARHAHAFADTTTSHPQGFDRATVSIIFGFAAAKMLGVGWQPNLSWWANHEVSLGPTLSGVSFIVMGIGFAAGSARRLPGFPLLAFPGLAALEWALTGHAWAWWVAVAVLGYWFGAYVTAAVSRLGWNRPETIGKFNSAWMLATDFPMALVPAALWEARGHDEAAFRIAAGLACAVTSAAGLWLSTSSVSPDCRAPS